MAPQRRRPARRALRHERREEDADDHPERGSHQRRDDALVPDHHAHLAPSHADGAQHPQLTCALEDVRTSVLMIPTRLTITDNASSA